MTTLQEILAAREERSLLRHKANAGGKAAVSMNLNIPGIPKINLLYTKFFNDCKEKLKNWLLANRVFIDEEKEISIHHAAGDFYIVPLKSSGFEVSRLKQITEKFEQNHPLGRFIDVDVSDENGILISSGKAKMCFLCEVHSAIDCMHALRHPKDILRDFQQNEIRDYLEKERLQGLSQKISSLAMRSILYELSLTPKPGLVDKISSGIHTDMDFTTFIDSTAVISTYFTELFLKGAECNPDDLHDALPQVRQIGLRMEKDMFLQTEGINTQKGIIFLMGISLFSTGFLLKESDQFDQDRFITTIKTLCSGIVKNEFVNQKDTFTHGEQCFNKYQTGGIRYEAEMGFPTIFGHSLPLLEKENNLGNEALHKTLLSIMAVLADTNILYRSDKETLEKLQNMSKSVLENFSMDAYSGIIDFCMSNKISPGGSADLLSMTIFIFLLKNEL